MSSIVYMDFPDWLLNEMSKRGWSQADLARASGLNRQSISDYVNRRRTNPEPDALVAIANALNISPVTVYRAAGLLPAGGGERVNLTDWEHLLSQLEPTEQEEIYQILELKVERRKQAEQAAAAKNFRPSKVVK
jgi:transcriptional regulator with XRE-family HTH domain